MVFPLTGSLFADILNALENQEQSFLIDAESRTLVHADGITSDGIRYYSLPEWDSAAGFALRTEFADKLRAPLAKEELQRVLHSGRGVFKSFKNVLKEFPQVEKLWHLYKNKSMQRFIGSWYNSLREIWGLEQLELEPEENGDLLHDDFIFSEYDESGFSEISKIFLHAEGNCSDGDFPEQINKAALKLWEQQFSCCGKNSIGFICLSLSGEFAGFITAAPISEKIERIFTLTGFYVSEKYRGLGIGAELVSMLIQSLKDLKIESTLTAFMILPESALNLLEKQGFEKAGTGFFMRINKPCSELSVSEQV